MNLLFTGESDVKNIKINTQTTPTKPFIFAQDKIEIYKQKIKNKQKEIFERRKKRGVFQIAFFTKNIENRAPAVVESVQTQKPADCKADRISDVGAGRRKAHQTAHFARRRPIDKHWAHRRPNHALY